MQNKKVFIFLLFHYVKMVINNLVSTNKFENIKNYFKGTKEEIVNIDERVTDYLADLYDSSLLKKVVTDEHGASAPLAGAGIVSLLGGGVSGYGAYRMALEKNYGAVFGGSSIAAVLIIAGIVMLYKGIHKEV